MKGVGLRTGNPMDKRIYEIWRKMHYRCENEQHQSYHRYGGRGIKVCEEWDSLIMFGKWAVENGYSEDLTLDRIDNDGNYEPSNCRWATPKEQVANRNVGVKVEIDTTARTIKKSFSVRQRRNKWEYRIEGPRINGKRHQITKYGFPTKEAAIEAAQEYIKQNVLTNFADVDKA